MQFSYFYPPQLLYIIGLLKCVIQITVIMILDYLNSDELKLHCAKLTVFVKGPAQNLVLLYALQNDSVKRCLGMHYPEVNYSLLENYLTNNA